MSFDDDLGIGQDDGGGAAVLDQVQEWFGRFIAVPDPRDLSLLAVWVASTHLAVELYTTPRLQIDSTLPGSGKTTLLDHCFRLAHRPVQAATLSSPALLPRLLENGVRTILLDEVDRSLRPDKPGVPDLIGILNSGYRRGATRPVLVPVKGGGWEPREMSTFGPVMMAGNSPHLPDDTRSRSIRILLMPDLDGVVEDSDWEYITDAAAELKGRIEAFADGVREDISGMAVELPTGCIGRSKEKWRPLKRVAVAAGGRWPGVVDELIARNLGEDAAERDAGLRHLPPGMVLLTDLHKIWPGEETFVPTGELVSLVTAQNPDYWGERSPYGKALTDKRFGHLIAQASKVTSQRPGGVGRRGYSRADLQSVWLRLGIGRTPLIQSGGSGESGESGGDNHFNRVNSVHRIEADTPNPSGCNSKTPATDEAGGAYLNGLCVDCRTRKHSAGRPRCNECHRNHLAGVPKADQ